MNKLFMSLLVACLSLSSCSNTPTWISEPVDYIVLTKNKSEKALKNHSKNTRLTFKLLTKFSSELDLTNTHLRIAAVNGNVLLTGQTPKASIRAKAVKLAQQTKGVKHVYNQIAIRPATSLMTRSKDTLLTSKIKAALLGDEGVSSMSIKVITEDGVAYLMGHVDADVAKRASQTASRVKGVKRVVKVFS